MKTYLINRDNFVYYPGVGNRFDIDVRKDFCYNYISYYVEIFNNANVTGKMKKIFSNKSSLIEHDAVKKLPNGSLLDLRENFLADNHGTIGFAELNKPFNYYIKVYFKLHNGSVQVNRFKVVYKNKNIFTRIKSYFKANKFKKDKHDIDKVRDILNEKESYLNHKTQAIIRLQLELNEWFHFNDNNSPKRLGFHMSRTKYLNLREKVCDIVNDEFDKAHK